VMMRSPGPVGSCRAVVSTVTWTFAGFPRRIQTGDVSDRVWPACRVVTRVTGPPAVLQTSIQHGLEATTWIGGPAAIAYVSDPGALTGEPMATVVAGSSDVAGLGRLLAPPLEVGNGSDVEVDAVAAWVPDAPDRVTDQMPAAAPSATAMVNTSGPGRFHHGRLRLCLPRMATTLAEGARPAADRSRWSSRPGIPGCTRDTPCPTMPAIGDYCRIFHLMHVLGCIVIGRLTSRFALVLRRLVDGGGSSRWIADLVIVPSRLS
jgi:hypothetical protein